MTHAPPGLVWLTDASPRAERSADIGLAGVVASRPPP